MKTKDSPTAAQRRDAIYACLQRLDEWVTLEELAEALGWTNSLVRPHIAYIETDSLILVKEITLASGKRVFVYKARHSEKTQTMRRQVISKPWSQLDLTA